MKNKIISLLLAVFLVAGLLPITAFADDASATCDHSGWTEWRSTNSLPDTEGSYYLAEDVVLSDTWIVTGGTAAKPKVTNLCLNGHDIKLNKGDHESIINVPSGAVLNLYDCTGSGIINGKTSEPAIGVCIRGGSFTMNGGTINGNTAVYGNGGGVSVEGGSFIMNSGTISGNTGGMGGGVYVLEGSFTMNGGRISGNTSELGGGVYVLEGSFIMNGGSISGNRAKDDGCGGGVCVLVGSFTMNGGTISGNEAYLGGGVSNQNEMTMNGGTISGNTAAYGGGVMNDGANFICKMTLGGTARIVGNTVGEDANIREENVLLYPFGDDETYCITIGNGDNGASAPAKSMQVGVTLIDGSEATPIEGRITATSTTTTANDVQYFSSDNTQFGVQYNEGGYLELVQVDDFTGAVLKNTENPSQPEERLKNPPTGLTESNSEFPIIVGFAIAAAGLGVALIRKRKS